MAIRFTQNEASTRREEGEYPQRSLTDEQRSRRLIFGETLRAEALLNLGFVVPRFDFPVLRSDWARTNDMRFAQSKQIFQICSLVAPKTEQHTRRIAAAISPNPKSLSADGYTIF